MADPDHIEQLDDFDISSVRLYRAGLGLAALGVVLAGLLQLSSAAGWAPPGAYLALAWILVAYGTAAAIVNMHLYAKRIRAIIRAAGWLGVLLLLTATTMVEPVRHLVHHAGIGFLFVALSGFALKEQFCFRLPLMQGVPLLLAGSLVPLLIDAPAASAALLLAAGGLLTLLAVTKHRMPIHHDIGNKSHYEV